MDLPGFLVLPITPLLKRPVELNGAGTGTIIRTATAIPAFFRMKYDRRFACLRMWYIYIDLACLYTNVAPVTDFRVE